MTARPRVGALEAPRGWQREFEEVVLVHRERLHRLALRLCRNWTDAEDLVQETLLRAFRRFDGFTPGTNCPAWLAAILRNIFINQVTRQRRAVLLEDEDTLERAAARWERVGPTTLTPEDELLRRVIDDTRLVEALDRLPREFREVLLLAEVEGLTHREIAQMCELPIGTVMSRAFRARRLVRKALAFGPVPAGSKGGRRRMRHRAAVGTPDREFAGVARG
ncbi:MAG: sigma-70 family RNA polymerase sigma factor [Candidatus Rokubacteria bacterium]|nr:sigma-70 family RNA polymerase sigma factor [Candidatus Rokubacteria bacterium]